LYYLLFTIYIHNENSLPIIKKVKYKEKFIKKKKNSFKKYVDIKYLLLYLINVINASLYIYNVNLLYDCDFLKKN